MALIDNNSMCAYAHRDPLDAASRICLRLKQKSRLMVLVTSLVVPLEQTNTEEALLLSIWWRSVVVVWAGKVLFIGKRVGRKWSTSSTLNCKSELYFASGQKFMFLAGRQVGHPYCLLDVISRFSSTRECVRKRVHHLASRGNSCKLSKKFFIQILFY